VSSTQANTDEEPNKSDESVLSGLDFPRPQWSDALAGISVALVLIPQCIAYAAIAGMPPAVGLFASALPLIVFSLFASSPYLQTGPVATTSLLTFAGLTSAGFVPEVEASLSAGGPGAYVAAGMLLALIVGVIRIVFGSLRLGWVAYLISDPVMIGFTAGAAIIIMASQFPKCVGLPSNPALGTMDNLLIALQGGAGWSLPAIALSLATVALMVIGRKFHRLFPGVLLAVLIGLLATKFGVPVPTVGAVPAGLPTIAFDFPFAQLPTLLFPAIVIAFVGFAEPSAIARMFANEDGTNWNANREFFASGLANVASAISGGYPVGGSF